MKKGFTIIEIIVVITVIGLMLPLFVSIFFSITRLQMQLLAMQELKEQGDFVRDQIISTVRNNAALIDSTCSSIALPGSDQTHLCFYDVNNIPFAYAVDNSANVASYSAALAGPIYLLDGSSTTVPIHVASPSFTAVDTKTAQFKYTVVYTPVVDYLPQQTLTYQFYTYLRN